MMRAIAPWLLVLAGCPSDPSGNDAVLWLAPDMRETAVKLQGNEPHPY
jgi:hypothetical protein